MKSFKHLFGGNSKASAGTGPFSHLFSASDDAPVLIDTNKQKDRTIIIAKPSQHSRKHNVAVSDEAKANPILAMRLLNDTDLSSKKIITQLADAPQALSKFTQNFMETSDPTWEFQDEEDQVLTALNYSNRHGDANGYRAGRERAARALEKLKEPLTDDEHQSFLEAMNRMANEDNPDTPDNVEARRQADEEYKQEVANATARRNQRIRATGAVLPGDSKRVSGKAANPVNEASLIKSRLDAGLPATDTSAQ
ncbi:MAG: hypothetical protein WCB03_08430 [Rouxiella badensis]|uniref:hypothetical protein n=1 Tax=Rouxiella badensis TaxID=1646377 RepID=UPI003C476BD1